MTTERTGDYVSGLITELLKCPSETGCLEFKENNSNPEDIGEYISALSNSAALGDLANAYIVWGVTDDTHKVEGTVFRPSETKKGNENLENWLMRRLSPRLYFRFHELEYEGKSVVLLEIPRALRQPVQFSGVAFIRVGSYRQKLKDYPELERRLWRAFDATPFEDVVAVERMSPEDILNLLDYQNYFGMLEQLVPTSSQRILERLAGDAMIRTNGAGAWDVTNLGILLFTKDLSAFRGLDRKAVRVIVYEGANRLKPKREQVGRKGYAAGFQGLIHFVNALLPRNEVMGLALRREVPMYPTLAVRELIANALIHQDLSVTGAGPMIEIFDDRMEITNPGRPLISTERFLDNPPRSRNELLASFMRRVGVCEERGSGVDKVVALTEEYQLPAPIFEMTDESTRVILYAHKTLTEMARSDRVRACYLHACLRYVERHPMTNSSLRARFGIPERNSAIASRIIGDALEDKQIKPYELDQGKKYAKYLPFWA